MKVGWRVALLVTFLLTIGSSVVHAGRDRWDDPRDRWGDRSEDRIWRGRWSDRWRVLGHAQVDSRRDHDTLVIGRNAGHLQELRFDVRGGSVELHDMLVTFGDGSTFKPDVRHHFGDGASSWAIDLPGGRRTVQKVDFLYSAARRDRVILTLYGR